MQSGRSIRLARVCDQPTAQAAVAGLGFLFGIPNSRKPAERIELRLDTSPERRMISTDRQSARSAVA
jgi:hypothetical protein